MLFTIDPECFLCSLPCLLRFVLGRLLGCGERALSVVTVGGLAAPALAAVAGTVLTTVGGSAAAASAITGVMGSTVGAAAMIAGFGAGGAHVVGGKMARRVGESFIHILL